MTGPIGFSLVRTPVSNVPRRVVVSAVEDLTPSYRRIHLAGDFAGFQSLGADDHLRVFFVPADFAADDVASMREHPSREYTPVSWTDGSLVLDFVMHGGTGGPAMAWAQNAVPGTVAMIGGPRGSLVLDGRPEWWLLAGDRTALPAIRRHLERVDPGVPVDVIVIAEDPADEQELTSRGSLTTTWVASIDGLVDALGRTPQRSRDGFVFIAAEQSIVRPGRQHLADRGIDLEHAVVKGYWKRGEAEYHAPH